MLLDDFLEIYKKLFVKHRWFFVFSMVLYLAFVGFYFWKTGIVSWPSRQKELQKRVLDLEEQLHERDQVVATLTTRAGQVEFLKPLKFDERWQDDHSRETVGRLVEYAEFAITKNDFERAEGFYKEANDIQPTITVPYYRGRLAYRQGDLQRAEALWLEAIKRDPDNKYPDLRLYLGVLYYQIGRAREAQHYLRFFDDQGGGGGSGTF
jgi:tetratricopeptide (TPR) repeat protein